MYLDILRDLIKWKFLMVLRSFYIKIVVERENFCNLNILKYWYFFD